MTKAFQDAYIVKATHAGMDLPDGLTVFYAVMTDNAESGIQLAKGEVKNDSVVEATEARLSQVIAHALGLGA